MPDSCSVTVSAPDYLSSRAHRTELAQPGHALRVASGTAVTVDGTHRGAVHVESGGVVLVRGVLEGALFVSNKGVGRISGSHFGPVSIAQGGSVLIEDSGCVVGTLHVDGVLDNHGERSGSVRGSGSIRDHQGSRGRRADRTGGR